MPASEPPFMRFLKNYKVDDKTGCWIWYGETHLNGYGRMKAFGKYVLVHRFAYELYNGPIPNDKEILHTCDVKNCVNPDHLRIGTHSENMTEAASRGIIRSGDKHPMYGRRNPRPKQANPVIVLGKEYESQKSAERSLCISSGTVRYWLKNHPEKAQLIKRSA